MNSELKLRNKKTGKPCIVHIGTSSESGNIHLVADDYITKHVLVYETLAELNEDWEDYLPKEPLIKDEKIRKAVRAWAEANDLDGATFYTSSHFWYLRTFNDREQGIDFWLKYDDKPNLIESKYYTITELCGEEEQCES